MKSFEIAAYNEDTTGVVIDVVQTDRRIPDVAELWDLSMSLNNSCLFRLCRAGHVSQSHMLRSRQGKDTDQ